MDAERFKRIVALTDRVVAEGASALAGADPADVREVELLLGSSSLPEPALAMRPAIGELLDRFIADDLPCTSRVRSADGPPQGAPVKPECAGYEIGRLLGSGGHADVWEATEAGGERRRVAMKVLTSARVSRRFTLEREVIGRLAHPGIAAILEQGTTLDGRPCMVMELVEGHPFTEACVRHALTVRRRVELIVEVCRAVDHAHVHGIIHRDLKPANILVAYRSGEWNSDASGAPLLRLCAKVIDFGVAKALEHAGDSVACARETLPGQLIGTLAYMSPEQRSGTTGLVTLAVDIYALGTVLYESLTGRHRWDLNGLSLLQALDAMAKLDPTPLSEAAPHLPRDLVAVVEKALAARPEDRYASMREFGDDLERWLAGEPVSVHSPGIGQRMLWLLRRHPRAASMLAALSAVGTISVALATHRSIEQTRLGVELANWCETSIALINDVAATPGSLEGRDRLSAFVTDQIDHLIELVHATGGIPQSRLDDIVANTYVVRSVVLRQKGEIEQAGELRRKAMALREAALLREPSDRARRDLAYATILVGDVHRERDDELGAIALYEAAHAIYLGLARRAGEDGEVAGEAGDFDAQVQLLWSHDRLCDVALARAGAAAHSGDSAAQEAWMGRAVEHAKAMESTLAAMRLALGLRREVGSAVSSQPTLARLLHAEVATRCRLIATSPPGLDELEFEAMHQAAVAVAEELCAVAPDNVIFLQQLTGRLASAAAFEHARGDLPAAMRLRERQRVALRQALDREPGDLDTRCRLAECFSALAVMCVSDGRFEDAERWIAIGRDAATLLVQLQPKNPAYRGAYDSFGDIEREIALRRNAMGPRS
jgi:serine/threonine protein kinase/tetratricopeptide (TPR) repeat protein